jgi:hypothetical protein
MVLTGSSVENDRTEGREAVLWAIGIVIRGAVVYTVCLS